MPRKNKRKFFGKSNKNKSAKGNRDEGASATQQHESDSDEKCGAGEEEASHARQSGQSEDTSLVANDSAPVMGQLASITAEAHSAVTSKGEPPQNKATITLKVIQFVGEVPKDTRDTGEHSPHRTESSGFNEIGDDSSTAYKSINDGTSPPSFLQSESHDVGEVPKLDHNKEKSSETSHCQRKFDDNYRVESPQQVLVESHGPQRTKRHAMLIQEISESSSSEEVKQFLDTEASALESRADQSEFEAAKSYRIESPIDSSDENNNRMVVAVLGDVTVQEISESSSAESVKDEILASIAKQPPPQIVDANKICLKIINIKELPSEEQSPHPQYAVVSNVKSPTNAKSTSPTKLFECKTERKLNKAEEAILEALYGPKSLLQIPNLPLDAISEEGSECGSDVERRQSVNDDLDEEVFLPPSTSLPKKPPISRRRVAEPAVLINTKIIETETVPEGVNSWQTSEGDNELQAELVYLTSTSSSATDLSERNDFTDTEGPDDDNSEDTETNSMLENISVPSLDFDEHDTPLEIKLLRQSPVYSTDYYQEINEQKLTDILEEDEDAAPRSLDIIESQQQIEDINKELRHLVSEHEEQQQPRARSRCEKSMETEATTKEEIREERLVTHLDANNATLESVHGAGIENSDKTIISDNDKPNDVCASPLTTRLTRKDSSDSSSNDSSSNSQCTIIRQVETIRVDPLRELCAESLKRVGGNRDMNEGKITIHKKLNSSSRNAPQIPIIDELELHYECDSADLDGRENQPDRVITILQVPPEMSSASSPVSENKRWFGLQSAQNPNVMLALSPMQKSYVMNSPDSNTTSADVLLDMHRKFVERRAYHEIYDTEEAESSGEKSRQSQLESVNQLEDGYFGDRESSVENIVSSPTKAKCIVSATCDNARNTSTSASSSHENSPAVKSAEPDDFKMNSIRNCILRDEFFHNSPVPRDSSSSEAVENFDVKKHELEDEMSRLDKERRDLEEELKNLQSMQHFKREEFLFNEKKKEKLQERIEEKCQAVESNRNSQHAKDFNEFLNSNERLQQELYNEWQDKVLERYERKMQKTIKITSITESVPQEVPLDRAASEILKFVPLENEFMSKLRERRQRLSLPTELNSSTESMHHQKEETRKFSVDLATLENVPAHLHEFLNYYEEEISQTKNSDESGESKKALATPVLCCLIGVSICICGLYIGRHFLTKNLKLF